MRDRETERYWMMLEMKKATAKSNDSPTLRTLLPLPDLSQKVQVFCGDRDERHAEDWLDNFNQLSLHCSDDGKVMLVRAKLVGPDSQQYRAKMKDCV